MTRASLKCDSTLGLLVKENLGHLSSIYLIKHLNGLICIPQHRTNTTYECAVVQTMLTSAIGFQFISRPNMMTKSPIKLHYIYL